jgi:aminodeoxyfutalosine deaminase
MCLAPSATEPFIRDVPKVELHVHLEGSVQPATLRELARRKTRPDKDVEQWVLAREAAGYRYPAFLDFVEAFKFVALLLETPQDYAFVTSRMLEQLAAQKVRYAEVTLSAGVILWKKQSVEAIFESVLEAAHAAEQRLGLRVNWIFDAVRQFGAEHAREVVEWAGRYRSRGVVAFGIGGDEARGPAELFSEVFCRARDLGLHTVAHAGETCGPESVRRCVELLAVERIGHGLTAAKDPEVMAMLRERAIPLEVCLTSNVATGILKRIMDHPLRQMLEAGLVVTLHSDDPALFGTSLNEEFRRAATCFSLSVQELTRLCQNAARSAFLAQSERERLLAEINSSAPIG